MEVADIYLLVESCLCLIFTFLLYFYYAKKETSIAVMVNTLIIWYFTFIVICLTPYDIYLVLNNSSKPFLKIVYLFIYWTIFIFSWIINPFLQEFERSGEITTKSRILFSIKFNLIFYVIILGVILFIFIILFFIFNMEFEITFFFSLTIKISNYFGLFFAIILLGYSLIKYPANLWKSANIQKTIKYLEFKASKIYNLLIEAQDDLATDGSKAKVTLQKLKQLSNEEREKSKIVIYQDKLEELITNIKNNEDEYGIHLKNITEDEKELEKSNEIANVIESINKDISDIFRFKINLKKVSKKWSFFQNILIKAKESEDEIISKNEEDPLNDSLRENLNIEEIEISNLKVIYYLKIRPILIYIFFGIILILEGVLLVSEVIIKWYSILGKMFCENKNNVFLINISLIAMISLFFFFCFYSIFRLRISRFFGMYGGRNTDYYSLCFLNSNMCRLGFPLCLHCIQLLRYDNKTLFEKLLFIPELLDKQQIINTLVVPIILIVMTILNALDVVNKFLSWIGFSRFGYNTIETKTTIEEGKALLIKMNQKQNKS